MTNHILTVKLRIVLNSPKLAMQVISIIINDPSSDAPASLWPHSLARGLRNAGRIISMTMGLGAWEFSGFFTPKIAGKEWEFSGSSTTKMCHFDPF